MNIDYCILTDPGSRPVNEDRAVAVERDGKYCFVLCDGLGGHGKGDAASELVTRIIMEYFTSCDSIDVFLRNALIIAQEKLLELQKEQGVPTKMKTTVVMLVIFDSKCVVIHVGDSRLYRFRKGRVVSRTRDHSVPQMLVLAGEIEEKDIRRHPDRNKLLKAMGDETDTFKYETEEYDLEKGDAFLLCSDGFWEPITEFDMTSFLSINDKAKDWLDDMMKLVAKNGKGASMDNYTAVSVMVKG